MQYYLDYLNNYIANVETKLEANEKIELLDMIARMKHYLSKINNPSTNRKQLNQYISNDVNLTAEQKITLSNMLNNPATFIQSIKNLPQTMAEEAIKSIVSPDEKKPITPEPEKPTVVTDQPNQEGPGKPSTDLDERNRLALDAIISDLKNTTGDDLSILDLYPNVIHQQPDLL